MFNLNFKRVDRFSTTATDGDSHFEEVGEGTHRNGVDLPGVSTNKGGNAAGPSSSSRPPRKRRNSLKMMVTKLTQTLRATSNSGSISRQVSQNEGEVTPNGGEVNGVEGRIAHWQRGFQRFRRGSSAEPRTGVTPGEQDEHRLARQNSSRHRRLRSQQEQRYVHGEHIGGREYDSDIGHDRVIPPGYQNHQHSAWTPSSSTPSSSVNSRFPYSSHTQRHTSESSPLHPHPHARAHAHAHAHDYTDYTHGYTHADSHHGSASSDIQHHYHQGYGSPESKSSHSSTLSPPLAHNTNVSASGHPRGLRRLGMTRITAQSVTDAEERQQIATAAGISLPAYPGVILRDESASSSPQGSPSMLTYSSLGGARRRRAGEDCHANGRLEGAAEDSNLLRLKELKNAGFRSDELRAMHELGVASAQAKFGQSSSFKSDARPQAYAHANSASTVPYRQTQPNGGPSLPPASAESLMSPPGSPGRSRKQKVERMKEAERLNGTNMSQLAAELKQIFARPDAESAGSTSSSPVVLPAIVVDTNNVAEVDERPPPPLPPKDRRWRSGHAAARSVKSRHTENSVTRRVGVKFQIAEHLAEVYNHREYNRVQVPEDILRSMWEETTRDEQGGMVRCKELLHSAFGRKGDQCYLSSFVPQKNGFVHTVLDAYNYHHHLVIRPDDVWIAILSQLNLYVNAHAEDLRQVFVSHDGKKQLEIRGIGTRDTADFGWFTTQMGQLLRTQVKDARFAEFVLPTFSTTTESDVIITSAMMMSTLKAYFAYVFSLRCGIPTVTLLGKKADYEDILTRLMFLLPSIVEASDNSMPFFDLGKEVQAFVLLLQPIIRQFSAAFDSVQSNQSEVQSVTLNAESKGFWSRICHVESGGSGPSYLSGWLSAFCVWNDKGAWQGPPLDDILQSTTAPPRSSISSPPSPSSWHSAVSFFGPPQPLQYAGMNYPVIDLDKVPPGFCDVDVLLDDNGELFDCMLVAGHIGMIVESQENEEEDGGRVRGRVDTLRPAPQWFMFIKHKFSTSG